MACLILSDQTRAHDTVHVYRGPRFWCAGATAVPLVDILNTTATTNNPLSFLSSGGVEGANASEWEGEQPIRSRPPLDKTGQVTTAAALGAMAAGPVGAAAGAALGALFEPKIKGNIRFRAKYFPLPTPERFEPPADIRRVSVTEGVDWHRLAIDAGGAASTTSGYELCCIVQSEGTGCTALLYRDQQRKHLAVAFRGTCCATDVITDVNLIQEPWVEGEKDAKCMVHAGFRGSLASISRRLKELLVAAAEGDPAQWDLLVCGHSLGGALATMFVADIAEYGIDAGRGLPTVAKSEPWWGRLWGGGPKAANVPPPRPRSLQAYTFGSPRVGNAEFVARFEATGVEAWRVVNSADVVARVPRAMFSTLGGTKSYEHCGPTVLVSAGDGQCPLWIEGVSQGACPVRDGTPITNPFSKGNLLGDVYETTKEHFELATGDLELLKEQMGVDEPEVLLSCCPLSSCPSLFFLFSAFCFPLFFFGGCSSSFLCSVFEIRSCLGPLTTRFPEADPNRPILGKRKAYQTSFLCTLGGRGVCAQQEA